jgi:hypothetical protein
MTDQIDELSNNTLQSVAKKRADQSKEAGGIGVNNPTRAKAMDLLRKSDNAKYRHTEHPSKVTPKTPAPAPTEADKAAHAKANKAKVDSQNNRGYGEGRYMGDSVEQTEVEDQIDELSMDTVKSYKDKVKANPAPSKTTHNILHKAIRRFAGKERAEDRIHSDEMKKMRERLGLKNEEVLDEDIGSSIKKGIKSVKRGFQGWADTRMTPGSIQKRTKELTDDELADQRAQRDEPGNTEPGKHSPVGLQRRLHDREKRKRDLANEEVITEGAGIGDLVKFHKIAGMNGHRYAQISGFIMSKKDGNIDPMTGRVHGTATHYVAKLKKDPLNTVNFTPDVHIPVGDVHKVDQYAEIQNHKAKQKMLGKIKGESIDEEVTFSGKGANGVQYKIIKTGDDHAIHANGKHIDTYGSHQRAMSVLKNEVPGLKADLKEEVLDEDAAQKNMGHAMDTIEPSKRDAARKQYGAARSKGLTHASSISLMHQRFGGTNEEVDEAFEKPKAAKTKEIEKSDNAAHARLNKPMPIQKPIRVEEVEQIEELSNETLKSYVSKSNKHRTQASVEHLGQGKWDPKFVDKMDRRADHSIKAYHKIKNKHSMTTEEVVDEEVKTEKPKHKVGDTVWATSPTNKALTMTGKVTKIGVTLTTVKHKDGSEAHYPHKLVNNDYEVLHPNSKKWQREHLEQTGELLSLSEVKYILENAAGGAGVIAQHSGVNDSAPQGTGRVKKMMGNKTDAVAIAKIIANGVASKEQKESE